MDQPIVDVEADAADGLSLEAITHQNVTDLVEARLRAFISARHLQPGDKLPSENQIATELGVGRNAVREGLRSLQSLGMLEVRHGKGRYLKEFDFTPLTNSLAYSLVFDRSSLKELLHIRRVLEIGFIQDAISELSSESIGKLERIVKTMWGRPKNLATFVQEDMEFHRELFRGLDNPPLLRLLEVFWLLFEEVELKTEHTEEQLMEAVYSHELILEAIKRQDVEAARSALDAHFEDAEGRIDEACNTH